MAYTRNDYKTLKGDVGLRKQVKMSKNMLGYCTPIALESNGLYLYSLAISKLGFYARVEILIPPKPPQKIVFLVPISM